MCRSILLYGAVLKTDGALAGAYWNAFSAYRRTAPWGGGKRAGCLLLQTACPFPLCGWYSHIHGGWTDLPRRTASTRVAITQAILAAKTRFCALQKECAVRTDHEVPYTELPIMFCGLAAAHEYSRWFLVPGGGLDNVVDSGLDLRG